MIFHTRHDDACLQDALSLAFVGLFHTSLLADEHEMRLDNTFQVE